MVYEATAEEIVRIFAQWEQAASHSPNPNVSRNAPLAPPTIDEATALLPRLAWWRATLERLGADHHFRPIGEGMLPQAAMGALWEEWRHDKLGIRNGYREIWTYPDYLYDATPSRSR
jgi:hypothetical protein